MNNIKKKIILNKHSELEKIMINWMKFPKKDLTIKKGKHNKASKEKVTKRNFGHIIIIKKEID